jgi:hypothetical protein
MLFKNYITSRYSNRFNFLINEVCESTLYPRLGNDKYHDKSPSKDFDYNVYDNIKIKYKIKDIIYQKRTVSEYSSRGQTYHAESADGYRGACYTNGGYVSVERTFCVAIAEVLETPDENLFAVGQIIRLY